jgi:hypothetical protein
MAITVHDSKRYDIKATAPTPGVVRFYALDHPSGNVTVGKEYSWYVVAKVYDGFVRNPTIAYFVSYAGSPTGERVQLVRKDGSVEEVRSGGRAFVYIKGDQPPGATVDSRDKYRGVIFPEARDYVIYLEVGSLSDSEAAMGAPYGNVYSFIEYGAVEFTPRFTIPLTISVSEPIVLFPSLIAAAMPVIVPLAAIGINEMKKR